MTKVPKKKRTKPTTKELKEQAEQYAKDRFDINTTVGYNRYTGFMTAVDYIYGKTK